MVEIGREYEGDIFGSVVIDGNNAITETVEKNKEGKKRYIFRLERLKNTIQEVEELGWPTKTVLKERTYLSCLKEDSTLTEPQKTALKQMRDLGMITLIPPSNDRDLDDKIMIQYALDHDSWILTGDTFRRDHIPRLLNEGKPNVVNEINKRRVNLVFGPNHKPIFCLPQNLTSLEATKIVSDTQNLELDIQSGDCPMWLGVEGSENTSITVPMREPIGRPILLNKTKIPQQREAILAVSRTHFRIDWDGTNFYLTDINSTNGTKIDELKIPPHIPQMIHQESTISIGNVRLGLR